MPAFLGLALVRVDNRDTELLLAYAGGRWRDSESCAPSQLVRHLCGVSRGRSIFGGLVKEEALFQEICPRRNVQEPVSCGFVTEARVCCACFLVTIGLRTILENMKKFG